MKVLLIGAGDMAQEYNKVLKDIDCSYEVIGRGENSAQKFEQATGKKVVVGGIDNYLTDNKPAEFAIVATGVEALASNCNSLINAGVKNILVEKPAGMNKEEITNLNKLAQSNSSNIFVAYNRRFFSSVIKAQEIIKEDGGVTSFNFEFTEWSHVIEGLTKADGVMEQWFLANSTHVVDLAFYLGGTPEKLSSYTSGGLKWHSRSSNFAGAGVSNSGALFSYIANWEAPGRWRVEVLTKKHRLYFSPMEKLQIQEIGSVALTDVAVDDNLDQKYKPGLHEQVTSFLGGKYENLCTIDEQASLIDIYNRIAGYYA